MKELSEKSEVLQQEEQQKKSWEIKAAASEKQIEQLQVRQGPANPLPSRRWGGGLNCMGLAHSAVGRGQREMSVHGWKASCLADLLIVPLPPPTPLVCHMPCAFCAASPAKPGEHDALVEAVLLPRP